MGKNRKIIGITVGILFGIFLGFVIPQTPPLVERVQAAPVSFSITLPENTTYYTRGLDVRAVNTTNNVDWARMRYNNGTWSSNYTMTWDAANSWWEYETTATFWAASDAYQVQVIFNSTDAEQADQSVYMTIDTTPTFTYTHPVTREYSEVRVPVEYTVPGAASYQWNLWDGSAWVYASNQTGAVALGLNWETDYTVYAYATDSIGTEVADSSRTFSTGVQQGPGPIRDTIEPPKRGVVNWVLGHPIETVVLLGAGYWIIRRKHK